MTIIIMKIMIKKRRRRREKRFIHRAYLCITSCSCHWPADTHIRNLEDSTLLTPSSSSSWLLSCTHKPLPGACCSQKWSDIHCNLSLECTIQKNLKGLYNNLFHFQSGLEEFFFSLHRSCDKRLLKLFCKCISYNMLLLFLSLL